MLDPDAEAIVLAAIPDGRPRRALLKKLAKVPVADTQVSLARLLVHYMTRPKPVHYKRKWSKLE